MVALAPQGEDNFILNDLALLEISPGDHRVEVLDNKIKRTARLNFFLDGGNKRPPAHDSDKYTQE